MSKELQNNQGAKNENGEFLPSRLVPKVQSRIQPNVFSRIQPKLLNGSGKEEASEKSASDQLPEEVQSKMENSFGQDFSEVKIHKDSSSAKDINAKAYTKGKEVHFAPGEYNPASQKGQELIGHELTHVVQQGQGKVGSGEIHGKGLEINQDESLEKEADEKGILAAKGEKSEVVFSSPLSIQASDGLHQPIIKTAPTKAITITEFIKLVEAEESKFPPSEQLNTKLMITRLRKIFYNTEGWDQYLIQGAKEVKGIYKTTESESERYELDPEGPFNSFDVVKKSYQVKDEKGITPSIYKNQEIKLDKGSYKDIGIDMGHVFAGLDAINFPNEVGYLYGTEVGIDSNVDATTWVGDLGSVLAEIQFKYLKTGKVLTTTEAQDIINEYASPQDMLGNIDAYVIGRSYDMDVQTITKKVSEMLKEYYLGDGTKASMDREKRYSIYAKEVGLKGWDGSSFNNEASWIEKYTDQVNDAAALYVGANTDSSIVSRRAFAVGVSMNGLGKRIVVNYLNSLKTAISTE